MNKLNEFTEQMINETKTRRQNQEKYFVRLFVTLRNYKLETFSIMNIFAMKPCNIGKSYGRKSNGFAAWPK